MAEQGKKNIKISQEKSKYHMRRHKFSPFKLRYAISLFVLCHDLCLLSSLESIVALLSKKIDDELRRGDSQ